MPVKKRPLSAAAAISASFIFLVGCAIFLTDIGKIRKSPSVYENKTVIVYGEVVSSEKLPFGGKASFVLRDATGEIKVVTDGALPKTGTKKLVRGTVHSSFILFEKHFGVVIKQE